MGRDAKGTYRLTFSHIECSDLLAADIGGSSDPYIKFIFDSVDMAETGERASFKFWKHDKAFPSTSFKNKTLNPKWDKKKITLVTTSHSIKAEAMLYLAVYDHDFLSDDDILGTLPLNVQQIVAMPPGDSSKELLFDRPLERYGKRGGRI